VNAPKILLLSLSIAAALSACQKPASTPAAGNASAKPEAAAYTLDDAKLPPVNRFLPTDLDTSKNACTDFSGYVNGKWLAANAIPVIAAAGARSKCWMSARKACSVNLPNKRPQNPGPLA
jgi:putative endopeptidase